MILQAKVWRHHHYCVAPFKDLRCHSNKIVSLLMICRLYLLTKFSWWASLITNISVHASYFFAYQWMKNCLALPQSGNPGTNSPLPWQPIRRFPQIPRYKWVVCKTVDKTEQMGSFWHQVWSTEGSFCCCCCWTFLVPREAIKKENLWPHHMYSVWAKKEPCSQGPVRGGQPCKYSLSFINNQIQARGSEKTQIKWANFNFDKSSVKYLQLIS